MITGVHAMFYTPAARQLRAFIKDKLRFSVTDTGDGWLVFDLPAAEVGCHPARRQSHNISFYCDDIRRTMVQLKARGVQFASGIVDEGWGLTARFRMPGAGEVLLYQPAYRKTRSGVRRRSPTRRRARA